MKAVPETELAARAVAPRVSQADVDAAVLATHYHVFEGTNLTVCVITLRNGYVVTGESACADPANFQRDIGERIARGNAVNKIWPLLGFMLCEHLYGERAAQLDPAPGGTPLDTMRPMRAVIRALGALTDAQNSFAAAINPGPERDELQAAYDQLPDSLR